MTVLNASVNSTVSALVCSADRPREDLHGLRPDNDICTNLGMHGRMQAVSSRATVKVVGANGRACGWFARPPSFRTMSAASTSRAPQPICRLLWRMQRPIPLRSPSYRRTGPLGTVTNLERPGEPQSRVLLDLNNPVYNREDRATGCWWWWIPHPIPTRLGTTIRRCCKSCCFPDSRSALKTLPP